MPRGGKRPGAGMPKGYKFKHTIEKELEREKLRQLVAEHLTPMVLSQISNAKGVSYMVVRHPDGTFTRATDEKQIDAALAAGGESFQIFTQAPNPSSFKDLLDRAHDKPKEQPQEIQVSGSLELVTARLLAARKRLADQS
jgi:hypothetical protein